MLVYRVNKHLAATSALTDTRVLLQYKNSFLENCKIAVKQPQVTGHRSQVTGHRSDCDRCLPVSFLDVEASSTRRHQLGTSRIVLKAPGISTRGSNNHQVY
jgi:hypothetical protein